MVVMKLILIAIFFAQTLFSFEVTELKTDFHKGKYHLTFKIDEKTAATITCEDETIDIVLEEGKYDIALDSRVLNIVFDKVQKITTHENNTTLNIIYPKAEHGTHFKFSQPTRAIKVPKNLSFKQIMDEVQNKRVIFVGEKHDQFAHHLNQLKVVKSMHQRGKKFAIGMEMFQRKFQNSINEYLQGKIDLKTFLKYSEYFKRWGFDYNLYKPIIDYAKQNKIPIIALNLERELTKKISKNGLFGLSHEEQAKLPQTIDFSNKEYKEELLKFFGTNMHMKKSKMKNLDFIYQSQILWDQTMADSINNYLTVNKDKSMVVLVGSGHLKMRYGIPDRVPYSQTVMLQDEEARPKSADFILFTDPIERQKAIKLGVGLEFGKLRVTEVSEESLAQKLGLKKGDFILKIDGKKVKDIFELKLALFFKKPNEPISLTYKRGKKIITQSSK
jgi:uncharacterized iron-regulated protein